MPQSIPSLLIDLPRGDPDRYPPGYNPRAFHGPDAAFTEPDMMHDPLLRWRPGKLFLGVVDGVEEEDEEGRLYVTGGVPIGVKDDRHICTFAGSRAGKGRAVIVPNMLHYPGSVLALDPKGELAMITARQRQALGHNVHVLDPFGITKEHYPGEAQLLKGFNPVSAMRKDHLVEDAALIADAIVVRGDSRDPHWDESALAFIEGLLLHIRTWGGYQGRASLLTLRDVIGRAAGEPRKTLWAEMRLNEEAGGVIQSAADDFFQRPEDERGSVLSSARRHLKFIDMFRNPSNAYGRHTLARHDFRLSDLKNEKTTIYLCLPARHMGTCSRWLRMFVNLTLQAMEETRVKNLPADLPVLFILDEFATLGHMKQLEDSAGQIAGHGVRLWPVLQDLGQLKALYEDRWETFLGNAGVLQFFGNNDLTTLEWISRFCGKTSIQTIQKKDMTIAGGGEIVLSEVHDLLTPDEAARYFGRDDPRLRQLVVWAGRRYPLQVLQRAYYDKHELFAPGGAALFDKADL